MPKNGPQFDRPVTETEWLLRMIAYRWFVQAQHLYKRLSRKHEGGAIVTSWHRVTYAVRLAGVEKEHMIRICHGLLTADVLDEGASAREYDLVGCCLFLAAKPARRRTATNIDD